jgi:polyphosphate kinase
VWIGSADMMHRNLDRRVEALVRLGDPDQARALVDLVDLAADPGTASWHLGADGTWSRAAVDADGRPLLDLQELLIAARSSRRARRR